MQKYALYKFLYLSYLLAINHYLIDIINYIIEFAHNDCRLSIITFQNMDVWDALQPGGFFPDLGGFSKIVRHL